jgi:acetyl esterase/lipase
MVLQTLPLYPKQTSAPNVTTSEGGRRSVTEVNTPELTVVVPSDPTGAVALIFPGGGYQRVCVDKEGIDVADELAQWGVASLVVTYRQPREQFVDPPLPLADARSAMILAGKWAQERGLDPGKILVMGFSAGGHLALTLVREPGPHCPAPSRLFLAYPVVSLHHPFVHQGSRDQLLGPSADEALVRRFEGHRQLPMGLCPTFLVHADNDPSVPVGNSLILFEALRESGAAVTLVRHPTGGHGFGLGPRSGYPDAPDWVPAFREWLNDGGWAR